MSYILLRKVIFQLPNGIFHFFLAFPFGESGFCERSEQKTREVLHFNKVASVYIIRITDLYRLEFHFIPSSHFPQRGKQEWLEILLTKLYLPCGKFFYCRRGRRLGVPKSLYIGNTFIELSKMLALFKNRAFFFTISRFLRNNGKPPQSNPSSASFRIRSLPLFFPSTRRTFPTVCPFR